MSCLDTEGSLAYIVWIMYKCGIREEKAIACGKGVSS